MPNVRQERTFFRHARFFTCDRLPPVVEAIAMRSSVRARAVLPLVATISVLVAPECVAHADEAAPSSSAGSNSETADERFRRFKAEGDRALAEKRLHDAIKAYSAAMHIRRDPLVAGRVGLTISYFDDPEAFEVAAQLLYEAVADAAGVSLQEKNAFFAAYTRVRRQVCKLSIDTNDANARIDLGGDFDSHQLSFFVFVKKGKGETVGRLKGREDIRKTWDCAGDQDIELRFDFPPAATDPPKTITVMVPAKETVKIVHVPIPVEHSIAKPDSKGNRLGVLFGPSVIFGVAPSPAWGLSLSSTYKFERWSAMLGARSAYAFGPIEGQTLDVFNFGAFGGPCFRERWFSACAFGSMNIIKWIPTTPIPDNFDIPSQVMPGIGIGVRGQHLLSNRIGLYCGGDITILSRDVELMLSHQDARTQVWNGGQFLLSLSLGVEMAP